MSRSFTLDRGFTLIELMVTIVVIGILSAVLMANLSGAGGKGRDLDRQNDLRALQTAIENYKRDNGRYPAMGCSLTQATGDGFASESECDNYIEGLVPNYLDRLPRDPRRDTGEEGYSYTTNGTASGVGAGNGTVYKIMAMRTVESEQVTYAHPMKSCAVNFITASADTYPNVAANAASSTIDSAGWCSTVWYRLPQDTSTAEQGAVDDCVWKGLTIGSGVNVGVGNNRFDTSYGLWGGFEASAGGSPHRVTLQNTTSVICE